MGGEDLLAQRRAGGRHANDEDRRRIGIRSPLSGCEARPAERGNARLDEGQMIVAGKPLDAPQ
jgi:hypothetical protein